MVVRSVLRRSPASVILAWVLAGTAFVRSAESLPSVLEARCLDCHGGETQKSGLRLDSQKMLPIA